MFLLNGSEANGKIFQIELSRAKRAEIFFALFYQILASYGQIIYFLSRRGQIIYFQHFEGQNIYFQKVPGPPPPSESNGRPITTVLPKFLGKIKLYFNFLFLHTEPTMFYSYMHPAQKMYRTSVFLLFNLSARNHLVCIPLVFKVQYFKFSFADSIVIKLGLYQTSSDCCWHPRWHHMHLRVGPGQSIEHICVCFHRPSGTSVFHRHIKQMVDFSNFLSHIIPMGIPVGTQGI